MNNYDLPYKRTAIPKKLRALVYNKTQGKCGYCGEVLVGRWQVDHMKPVVYGCDDSLGNLIASCSQCNNLKHQDTVEEFRRRIETQIDKLMDYSVNYRTARRFEMVKSTPHPIVFYFEKRREDDEQREGV